VASWALEASRSVSTCFFFLSSSNLFFSATSYCSLAWARDLSMFFLVSSALSFSLDSVATFRLRSSTSVFSLCSEASISFLPSSASSTWECRSLMEVSRRFLSASRADFLFCQSSISFLRELTCWSRAFF